MSQGTIIISSPLSRCKKTAEIIKNILKTESDIIYEDRLRERWFGQWDKTSNENYPKVWSNDKTDPDHTVAGVESANSVQIRALSLIQDLEKQYTGKTILLISHGDILQILQTGLKKQSASLHREIPSFELAEIRVMRIF